MVPDRQAGSDSILSSAQAAGPAFGFTLGDGGGGAEWVRVSGELDRVTAPQLAQLLGQASRRARIVVVDLRGLTRVDSSGVDTIVAASRNAHDDGGRLVLVRGLSQVERLLALTGALRAVEIVDLNAGEPALLALLQIARKDHAFTHQRAARRVATLHDAGITRRVDRGSRAAPNMTSPMARPATSNVVSMVPEEDRRTLQRASS
jgi:anti-anti-sigma factor